MPRTADDVDNLLLGLHCNYERDGDATFIVSAGAEAPPVVVHVHDPIVVVRVDIGKQPTDEARQLTLFRQLLEHNAKSLVHSAYGLEDGEIVLTAGLALENIDGNELAAVLSEIDLALARQVQALRELAEA